MRASMRLRAHGDLGRRAWVRLALAAIVVASLGARCEGRPRSQPIRVGETVRGELDERDHTDVFADRSYTDLYELRLASGEAVTIELGSEELDTYLSLMRGPGDQVVDNDDVSSDDTDSRVVYTSPGEARYFVAVTSFRPGATGAYVLSIRRGGEPAPE